MALASTTSEAFRTSNPHPFSGANKDAQMVEFDNHTSHKAHAVQQPNKYESMINKETMTKRKTAHQQFFEYFTGASDEQVAFEKALEKNARKSAYGKHRLGVEQQITLTEPSDGVYAA